jgi:hypothetical protein
MRGKFWGWETWASQAVNIVCLEFAVWTICCHAIVLLDRNLYVLLAVAVPSMSLALAGYCKNRRRFQPESAVQRTDPSGEGAVHRGLSEGLILLILILFAVTLTLVVNKPNLDEPYYVNMAVGVAENPGLPLLKYNAMYNVPSLPVFVIPYRYHSVEALAGTLSFVSGIPAIYILHVGLAALAAVLLILAYSLLFRLLDGRRTAAAVALAVVVLLCAGSSRESLGNYAFVRLFQGKAVYAAVAVPLILYFSLFYARRPSVARWILLQAAVISGQGLTSSSLFVTFFPVVLGLLAGFLPRIKTSLVPFLAGCASLIYTTALTIKLEGDFGANITRMVRDSGGLDLLMGNMNVFFGNTRWMVVSLLVLGAGWLVLRPGPARRLAILLALSSAAVVFNPLWLNLIPALRAVEYWRLFWALPLPLLIPLVLLAPLDWQRLKPRLRTALCLVAVLAFVALLGRDHVLRRSNARLGPPGLKVDPTYSVVRALGKAVPPRSTVLATDEIGVWLVTLQPQIFALRVRAYDFNELEKMRGPEEIKWRETLLAYITGLVRDPKSADTFEKGLDRYAVAGVCFSRKLPWRREVISILNRTGFIHQATERNYEIWVRRPSLIRS